MAGKTTAFNMVPPVIYEVSIPGIRYAPAAYISNLVVESIGQVNNVRLPATIGNGGFLELNDLDINVPDAWNITIQLTELLPETRNIFAGVFNSANKIRVITGEGAQQNNKKRYIRKPI
jgi:hypothetical protein